MRVYLSILVFITISTPGYAADNWQQRFELERQSQAIEQLTNQVEQARRDYEARQRRIDSQTNIDRERAKTEADARSLSEHFDRLDREHERAMEFKKLQKSIEKEAERERTRNFVERKSLHTKLKFNQSFFDNLQANMQKHDFTPQQIDDVQTACKYGLLKLEERAEAGNAKAQHKLGFIYLKGSEGIVSNTQLGYDWYVKAANQGDETARRVVKILDDARAEGKI